MCLIVPADALRSVAQRLMPLMNQQELCNTVWAMGVLGLLDTQAWEVFCDCLANVQGEANCQTVQDMGTFM